MPEHINKGNSNKAIYIQDKIWFLKEIHRQRCQQWAVMFTCNFHARGNLEAAIAVDMHTK